MTIPHETAAVETPALDAIRARRSGLAPYLVETPVARWRGPEIEAAGPPGAEVFLKLELLQVTGTFKPRGALSVILDLDAAARGRGVTAVSAGNHAIAVAYAARLAGTAAKVVMPASASPFRVERCRRYGAQIVLTAGIAEAFETVRSIERAERRTLVHPFEGPLTALGTATLGLELAEQLPGLDAVIVPIGGGGLCAGVASALAQLQPGCTVYGVEPEGAPTMRESLAAGRPGPIAAVRTIADSLGAPYTEPYSFALCRRHLAEVVLVSDAALRRAMAFVFANLKLAVEPAGAAATAALLGPLRERLAGRRVALVVCGSNIDLATFHDWAAGGHDDQGRPAEGERPA